MPSTEHDSIQQWFLSEIKAKISKEVNINSLSNHRVDVLIEDPRIAIEIQCSPITVEEYRERNLSYSLDNYLPVWVFGKSFYNHARLRTGMIKDVEDLEQETWGRIFYHNKYDLFEGVFTKKFYRKKLGWYRLNKLSIAEFFAIILKEVL